MRAVVVQWVHDNGQTIGFPKGRIFGIVNTLSELDRISLRLEAAGFTDIEVLCGEEGLHVLERDHTFYFSDMEDRILDWQINELKAGHYILIVKTPADRAEEAADIAAANGARRLVHFGWWMNTWLTK